MFPTEVSQTSACAVIDDKPSSWVVAEIGVVLDELAALTDIERRDIVWERLERVA
ncbi:hypothetical protein BH10ACT2_BH10ACT2_08370 [soil metagenome]